MYQKLKEWQFFDDIVDIAIMGAVFLVGLYGLYLHNNVFPILYFIFGLGGIFYYKNLAFRIILAGFPVIFLVYCLEWDWLGVEILLITVWFILHRYIYSK